MTQHGKAFDWFMRGSLAARMRRLFNFSNGLTLVLAVLAVVTLAWGSQRAGQSIAVMGAMRELAEIEALVDSAEAADATLADGRADLRSAADKARELDRAIQGSVLLGGADLTGLDNAITAYGDSLVAGGAGSDNAAASTAVREAASAAKAHFAAASRTLESEGLGLMGLLVGAILLTAAGSLFNAVLGRRLVREHFVRPVEEVCSAMLDLAAGNRDVAVPHADRHDEIGEMARALEVVKASAHRFDEMRREREADREERDRLLRELAEQFERSVSEVVGGVAAATTQLQDTATAMASAASLSAGQTSDLSDTLGEASAGVTAAAAASDEFAMSIGEISRQAGTSAELARKATTAAVQADSTISALTESASQVGQIAEMISAIAQRTNLLALNASIEAARGGEAGRGFAVVAAEVKDLATQTGRFTEQVAEQIRSMQESTGASVDALRSIMRQIGELEATSISIAAAVDQQSIAGQDLARSIDMAARSTEAVSGNVAHMCETSLTTGAAASQVLSSASELERQAATLRQQMDSFLEVIRKAA